MSARPLTDLAAEPRSLRAAWVDFWFRPTPPLGLHALRVLFGALVLIWLLPLAGEVDAFFGLAGWFDARAFSEAAALPASPVDLRNWSLIFVFGNDPAALQAFYWLSILAVTLFTLGLFTRLTGVLTWLAVVSFTANPLIEADVDVFLRLASFYLMLGYLFLGLLDAGRPFFARLLSPFDHGLFTRERSEAARPSSAATVAVRLIQVHFALAVFVMGLHKLQFAEWWSGITYWYPLTRPAEISLDTLRVWAGRPGVYLGLISLAAYATLIWQLAFPFFAWRAGRARALLLVGAAAGCVGLIGLYRQPLLGTLFLILCLAYLSPEEWHRWVRRTRQPSRGILT